MAAFKKKEEQCVKSVQRWQQGHQKKTSLNQNNIVLGEQFRWPNINQNFAIYLNQKNKMAGVQGCSMLVSRNNEVTEYHKLHSIKYSKQSE